MKKKLLIPCMLLVVVMVLTGVLAFGASAAETMTMTEVDAGTKTPAAGDVVTISTEAELDLFSAYVTAGNATADITFRLENDIALTAGTNANVSTMVPIGKNESTGDVVVFNGVFDGNGKTISNYVMTNVYVDENGKETTLPVFGAANVAKRSYRSFISKIDGGEIKNLTLSVARVQGIGDSGAYGVLVSEAVNAKITGCTLINPDTSGASNVTINVSTNTSVAGIAGTATGSTIDSCVVSLNLKGYKTVGGIVGVADSTDVRNCIVAGSYENAQLNQMVGGIVGQLSNGSTVKNCYTNATISGRGALGGIAGIVDAGAVVENCASSATVTDNIASNYVTSYGLIVGTNNGDVINSFGLRAADKTATNIHSDVGVNNGTVTDVYAYTVTADGDSYVFTVGNVVTTDNGYEFIAADPAISLVDALNNWVTANTSTEIPYAEWVESGNAIANCSHVATALIPDEGKAPTCIAGGEGSVTCTICGKVLETGVPIPATTGVHTAPANTYACMDYDCIYCGEHVDATAEHNFSSSDALCIDRKCAICQQMIAPEVEHTKPADYDEEISCRSYTCTVCENTIAGDTDHEYDSTVAPCLDRVCTLCGDVTEATQGHRAGTAADCTKNQICLVCRTEIRPKLDHIPGVEADCGNAQTCTLCGTAVVPATGLHTKNKEHATCSSGVVCLTCGNTLEEKLIHVPGSMDDIDCGHGQVCTVCNVVLTPAEGEHTPDWTNATVVRAATADRTGIIVAPCTTCGRDVERYTAYKIYAANGTVSFESDEALLFVDNRVSVVIGLIADYDEITLADGYIPLQAATLSIVDSNGAKLAVNGNGTVTLLLNVSAAKLIGESIKLYQVNGTTATEVTATFADGCVTFMASGEGVYLIAAEEETVIEALGTLPASQTLSLAEAITPTLEIPEQTAALIGTPSYEKKDNEI